MKDRESDFFLHLIAKDLEKMQLQQQHQQLLQQKQRGQQAWNSMTGPPPTVAPDLPNNQQTLFNSHGGVFPANVAQYAGSSSSSSSSSIQHLWFLSSIIVIFRRTSFQLFEFVNSCILHFRGKKEEKIKDNSATFPFFTGLFAIPPTSQTVNQSQPQISNK